MKKFSTEENDAIKMAREMRPRASQRTLAKILHVDARLGVGDYGSLWGRSEASIYSAIRRFDAKSRYAKAAIG